MVYEAKGVIVKTTLAFGKFNFDMNILTFSRGYVSEIAVISI